MKSYSKIEDKHITQFANILSAERVKTQLSDLQNYGRDHTEDLQYNPEIVLLPETTEEVAEIMRLCHAEKLPVTVRGAGTGLSGGALPILGGVSLSMERMNQIVDIDEKNHQVTTQPGVITEILQDAVKEKGLFYPPDPASKGTCFIGGNIAENSGGPKAVKYGVVQDYVLNLEVVLADGTVIWTGANVLKNATGYNLTQLIVGSEGTLGIVTQIVLKLIPHPKHSVLMLAPFSSAEKACENVALILQLGITPSGLEFMERDAIDLAIKYSHEEVTLPVADHIQAHLIIELDGNYEEILMDEAEQIYNLLQENGVDEVLYAETEAQKKTIWSLRRSVGEAVKRHSVYKEEDTVVPRGLLPDLLNKVKAIGAENGFRSVCYGHAGDGNLHINILKEDLSDTQWNDMLPQAISELFVAVRKMGGTLSGEHGIGLVQKEYMPLVMENKNIEILRSIKDIFDPNHILNPGKIFPEA